MSGLAWLAGTEKTLTFLFVLSLLIVLHELGHFVLARRFGVRVNDFAVGFGPTLLKWTSPRSGTNYRLNAIPIGGYCAMLGEDPRADEAEQQREARARGSSIDAENFQSKPVTQRLAIVAAGPFANFVLTFLILVLAAFAFGEPSARSNPIVGLLTPHFPAERAGMHTGDRIVALNGRPVLSGEELIGRIHGSLGTVLTLRFARDGVEREVSIRPVPGVISGKRVGLIGFRPVQQYERLAPSAALPAAFGDFRSLLSGTGDAIRGLVLHPRQNADELAGPIGMARGAATIQDWGWGPYFKVAAAISLSLAIFNFLPFPALDGGRAAFLIAELLRGRPVDPEREALVHVAGFAVLMLVVVAFAYHDIAKIVAGKGAF